MISVNLLAIFYLISGVLFILALRGLSSPETSRQGNFYGIIGMVIAISVTFLTVGNFSNAMNYVLIFLVIGGAGLIGSHTVELLLKEDIREWFDLDVDSPYMLLVADMIEEKKIKPNLSLIHI